MQSTEQILASTPGNSQLPTAPKHPQEFLLLNLTPHLEQFLCKTRQDGHLAAAVGSAAEELTYAGTITDLLVSAEILEQNTAMRLAQQLVLQL